MAGKKTTSLELTCPCCRTRLFVDPKLGQILYTEQPPKQPPDLDLDHAAELLKQDAARRDHLFQQSVADEKQRSDVLDRKFKEALKKSRGEPVTRPLHDLDLD